MDDKTKIEQATIAKEKGTNRLKSKHIRLAIQHYSRILSLLDHMETKEGNDEYETISSQFSSLKLAANLNLSLVYPIW